MSISSNVVILTDTEFRAKCDEWFQKGVQRGRFEERMDESRAKATEGKAGMAGVTGPVRRSTAGTGLRVGEASADLPTTSEIMDVTAGETATHSDPPDRREIVARIIEERAVQIHIREHSHPPDEDNETDKWAMYRIRRELNTFADAILAALGGR